MPICNIDLFILLFGKKLKRQQKQRIIIISQSQMACRYMFFLPIFMAFIIHRIVFSSEYQHAKANLRRFWSWLMQMLRFPGKEHRQGQEELEGIQRESASGSEEKNQQDFGNCEEKKASCGN